VGRFVVLVLTPGSSTEITHEGDFRNTPAGDGNFSAADGKWTATADKPNDSGTYRFSDDKHCGVHKRCGADGYVGRRENTAAPSGNGRLSAPGAIGPARI
jgi:hypothetical protein